MAVFDASQGVEPQSETVRRQAVTGRSWSNSVYGEPNGSVVCGGGGVGGGAGPRGVGRAAGDHRASGGGGIVQ